MEEGRRNRRGQETRRQLLEIAARHFSARAYDEVTLEDVATEAGVAKKLVYYYFGTKRDCYLAVIEQFSENMLAAVDTDGHAAGLEPMLDLYLDFAVSAEPAYRTLVSGGLGNDAVAREFIAAHRAKYVALLSAAVPEELSGQPALRVALEGFLSFMEGATLEWLAARAITRDELRRMIVGVAQSVVGAVYAAIPVAPAGEVP